MTRTNIPNLPIRVVLVDGSVKWRQHIRIMPEMQPGELQVVGEASDGFQAVQKAEELGPNLILLVIGLPRLNGIEAATRISAIAPGSKTLFLSQNGDTDVVRAALQEGALGRQRSPCARPSAAQFFATFKVTQLGCFDLVFGKSHKHSQFGPRDNEFCLATIQAGQKLRKEPNMRFGNVSQARKMNGHLCRELTLIIRSTRLTWHTSTLPTWAISDQRKWRYPNTILE